MGRMFKAFQEDDLSLRTSKIRTNIFICHANIFYTTIWSSSVAEVDKIKPDETKSSKLSVYDLETTQNVPKEFFMTYSSSLQGSPGPLTPDLIIDPAHFSRSRNYYNEDLLHFKPLYDQHVYDQTSVPISNVYKSWTIGPLPFLCFFQTQ